MKKQLRKLSLAVVFAMAVSLITPAAQVAEAASTKTFTYAEQQTGDNVKTLVMDKGEKVDLKFNGVSNWKTYKYKWASSNTKVAVVDSAGVVTAINTGVATIKLTISGGDGTQYTSTGVTVYVGMDQTVTIGTGNKEEIKSHVIEMGQSVMLKANGIKDNFAGRYTFEWSSTDTTVATISNSGVVTAKAPGLTVIQLTVKKVSSGAVMVATPIALQVTAKGGSTAPAATATPTPAPTQKPGATATPTPKPTATPTPTPAVTAGSYSVTVTSDKSVTLNFGSKVTYSASDIKLSQIIDSGSEDVLIETDILSVELDDTGKKMVVTTEDIFENGKYNIKVGTSDTKGKDFQVSIGEPNRLEVIYTCLGQTGVAYAYDDEAGIDVPVQLSYKVYSGNVDVTETYETSGYINFELVSPTNSANVMMDGEQLYFYATKQTAAVSATYNYYTDNGTEKELKDTVSIISKAMGAYKITNVAKWTIIDDNDKSAIDWNKTVNKVVAGKDNYKVVALLADSYGYYYTTDERGVDKENNIYWVEDPDTIFYMKGYTCSFNSSDDDDFYIDMNGDLNPYQASNRAATYITLYNADEYSSGEKKMSAWYFTIQAEAKLSNLQIEETTVNIVTDAIDNHDRFCAADVVVTLYDQYGEKWNGDANLEVTSNVSEVTNAIYGIANVEKGTADGEWLLHIDAKALDAATTKNSVTLYVTDADTKKKDSVIVYLKNPETTGKGIVVKTWGVGTKDSTIAFGAGDTAEETAKAEIEIYKVSQQGNYNVGLWLKDDTDEEGNPVTIKTYTTSLTASNLNAGEIWVMVKGPDNKALSLGSSSDLGLWQDSNGALYVNVAKKDSNGNLTFMKKGTYTITATKVVKDGQKPSPKTAKFYVEDNTKNVSVASYGRKTTQGVSVANDPGAVDIVLELFKFELGGVAWTNIDASNIVSVTHTAPNTQNQIRITEIEFAVPADGENSTVTYQKKLTLNATITINQ